MVRNTRNGDLLHLSCYLATCYMPMADHLTTEVLVGRQNFLDIKSPDLRDTSAGFSFSLQTYSTNDLARRCLSHTDLYR